MSDDLWWTPPYEMWTKHVNWSEVPIQTTKSTKNEGKSNENLQCVAIQTVVGTAAGTHCTAFFYHTAVWDVMLFSFNLVYLCIYFPSCSFPHSLHAYWHTVLFFHFITKECQNFLCTFSSTCSTNSCPITSIEIMSTLYQVPEARRLTLSNPIFLPPAYYPTLIYFGRKRGWWVTCNYPTVLKEKNMDIKSTTCTICWKSPYYMNEKRRKQENHNVGRSPTLWFLINFIQFQDTSILWQMNFIQ
jgi:hypothetical protein